MNPKECVEFINKLLDDAVIAADPALVASSYAEHCASANERLEKISAMLDSGGEIQALQLAEQPPRVLDVALTLSFGDESSWQEYCTENGHKVAPMINADAVSRLLEIQDKGISANHPLYKDYRAAVMSRDDAKSLDLIRVIARMNPGDENAAKELERFKNKALQKALDQLGEKIESEDEEFLAAMDQVEKCGDPKNYNTKSIWKKASARRNDIRRQLAWGKMHGLLESAKEALDADDWKLAASLHSEYGSLVSSYGQNPDEANALDDLLKQIEPDLKKHKLESQRVADCKRMESELLRIVDEVETTAVTPAGVTPQFALGNFDKLARLRKKFTDSRGEMDASDEKRIKLAISHLKQVITKHNKRKKALKAAIASVVFLLLMAVGSLGYATLKASERADALRSLRESHSVVALEEMIERTSEQTWMLKFEKVALEIKESSEWVENLGRRYEIAMAELEAIENKRDRGYEPGELADVHESLQEAGELISELPDAMSEPAKDKLAIIRNDLERVMMNHQDAIAGQANQVAGKWSAILSQIDLAAGFATISKSLEGAAEELGAFDEYAENEHPLLNLPPAEKSKIEDLGAKVRDIRRKVDGARMAHEQLVAVTDPEQYQDALGALAEFSFRESILAQPISESWPDDDKIKAMVAFHGDLKDYMALADEEYFAMPMPKSVKQADLDVLNGLTGSVILNDLWRAKIKNLVEDNEVEVLTKGKLETIISEKYGEKVIKGEISELPDTFASEIKWELVQLPERNVTVDTTRTKTSAFMERLAVSELMNKSFTEYSGSVIQKLDAICNDTECHPLAKAYVYGQLIKLINNHEPSDWGLNYCPKVLADQESYRELIMTGRVGEGDWLVKKESDDISIKWKKFFDERKGRASYREMRLTRQAAISVKRKPLELAGFVDVAGKVNLKQADGSSLIIAIVRKDNKYRMQVCGILDAEKKWTAVAPEIAPLSPLLTIDLADDVQQRVLEMHAGEKINLNEL